MLYNYEGFFKKRHSAKPQSLISKHVNRLLAVYGPIFFQQFRHSEFNNMTFYCWHGKGIFNLLPQMCWYIIEGFDMP